MKGLDFGLRLLAAQCELVGAFAPTERASGRPFHLIFVVEINREQALPLVSLSSLISVHFGGSV
jgi:hypothetical protein